MIEVGKQAPAFSLPNSEGKQFALKDFKGKPLVLYFYPKDNTPGCTREACDFRDNFARITAAGAVVLGISADPPGTHSRFREKFQLPFERLSDQNYDMLRKYDVWKEKSLYGRTFLGIVRTTVIVDSRGYVAKLFPKVSVKGHVDEVLEALATIQ